MALSQEEIEKRVSDSYELPNNVLKAVPDPIVTVRTSTYQHASYIKECIEGVLMQKTDFPIEFIIGEDFSTDGTREIVFEYAEKYPDIIRVFTADYNVGSKANGQRCIRASRGRYMALCEGDDYWTDPLKLQKQVKILESRPNIVACFTNAQMLNLIKNENSPFIKNLNEGLIPTKKLVITGGGIYPTASLIFKTESIDLNLFSKYKEIAGDDLLIILLSLNGYIYFLDQNTCTYRRHQNGVYSKMAYDKIKVNSYRKKILKGLIKLMRDIDSDLGKELLRKRISKESFLLITNGENLFPYFKNLTIKDTVKYFIKPFRKI